MIRRLVIVLVLALSGLAAPATAHEFAPGLLMITERPDGGLSLSYRVGLRSSDQMTALPEIVGGACTALTPARIERDATTLIFQQTYRCDLAAGSPLSLALPAVGDAGLHIRHRQLNGREFIGLARTDRIPLFDKTIATDGSFTAVFAEYLRVGFNHILAGLDHLAFIACLVLLMGYRPLPLIGLATAFTVAHSVTLSLATLDILTLPSGPVETLIAFSVALLAAEVVTGKGRAPADFRRFWGLVFLFGLVHGLGFAGALIDIGIQPDQKVASLAGFNVGVELGQIGFILVLLAVLKALQLIRLRPDILTRPAGYGIGLMAGFWMIERLAAF